MIRQSDTVIHLFFKKGQQFRQKNPQKSLKDFCGFQKRDTPKDRWDLFLFFSAVCLWGYFYLLFLLNRMAPAAEISAVSEKPAAGVDTEVDAVFALEGALTFSEEAAGKETAAVCVF